MMDIDKQLKQIVENIIADVNANIQSQVEGIVREQVSAMVRTIPLQTYFNQMFAGSLANEQFDFPAESIPAESVQSANLRISGNQVAGGIISSFGSTGIEDKATACQLTILDDVTVVENNLLTKDLTVKGTTRIEGATTIDGDLIVNGRVPESSPMYVNIVNSVSNNVLTSLDQSLFTKYSTLVFQQIKKDGLDLNRITVNGQELVTGNALSSDVTVSNLQKVGVLKELQVSGETLLDDTLYTASKRVGINTLQPTQALDIWDQEIEIGLGKLEKNTATISVPRTGQKLVIDSNGQRNITVLPDGSTTLNKLNLGRTSIYSSDLPPAVNEPKGTIVFNSNPTLGGPLGWVSLGGAKWANFGIVD
jgi:hypothetical protein